MNDLLPMYVRVRMASRLQTEPHYTSNKDEGSVLT